MHSFLECHDTLLTSLVVCEKIYQYVGHSKWYQLRIYL